ncbi:ATP-binding protein [Jeotgalibacillus haloalkalitolerans]|uniref:ATP-binding protein n=1 Tax=Jeotgalibacillus haloalkalitolerans TaxID=3104292 RepID=A0ABU5KI06_9BACL|nr:ATP-binding protein [Jeotgalibacillus sp. HH7-29]MDZ5710877.1 ATP-binding protein [Jeotgalibacillus sp. HH7-29]
MKSIHQIMQLIGRLDAHVADDFEGQDLDFKQWSIKTEDNVRKMVEYAICMANGGGGSVVFGIADRVKGHGKTILGVPENLDIESFHERILQETVPPLSAEFDIVQLDYGTGQLLIMTVEGKGGPYSFLNGKSVVRKGKECLTIEENTQF